MGTVSGVLLGIGGVGLVVALGIPMPHSTRNAGLALSIPIVLIGVALLGIVMASRKKRCTDGAAPQWEQDYPWDPTGQDADVPSLGTRIGTLASICGALGMLAAATPMIYQHDATFAYIFGFLLTTFVLLGTFTLLRHILGLKKYGVCRVEFNKFPFSCGDQVDMTFCAPLGLGSFNSLGFTVRYVRERLETRQSGQHKQTVILCEQLYADEYEWQGQGEQRDPLATPLRFPLPSDVGGTALADRPPSYWELQVQTRGSWINCNRRFLLPVYSISSSQQPPSAPQLAWATEAEQS